MEHIFITHVRRHSDFAWGRMGDLGRGRPTLGPTAHRMALVNQNAALLRTLGARCGKRQARELFRAAGRLAGAGLAMHELVLEAEAAPFFEGLARVLQELQLGRLEQVRWDADTGEAAFHLKENVLREVAAGPQYLEGLLAGVMDTWTGRRYHCRADGETYHCAPGEGDKTT